MGEFGRVCGSHAALFRAILVCISHLNKLLLQRLAYRLIPSDTREYETVLQRLEAQGARSYRSRDVKKGGC